MKNLKSVFNIFADLANGLILAFVFGLIALLATSSLAVGFIVFLLLFGMKFMPGESGILAITANFAGSDLVTAQMRLNAAFADPEMRSILPQVFQQFRKGNVNISTPDVKTVRTREDRALAQYYLMRSSRALGTGRDHLPTGVTSTSNLLTPSFITYNDKFSISKKQADTNVYGFDEMMAHEIINAMKNFNTGNEANATAYLQNNRSGYNAAVADGSFNAVNDVFEINGASLGNQLGLILAGMMEENLHYGPITLFVDAIAFNNIRMLAAQGATNATNTAFQWNNMTIIKALDLTASAQALGYNKGYVIVVPDGTIAVYDWIPKQNVDGDSEPPYKYGSIINPVDGLTYAVYSWYQAYNSSSVGGYTQDILYNYELSQDLAFESAPLANNAGETVMYAAALV